MLKRLRTANVFITLAFLLIAILVVLEAFRWPFRSGLFPLLAGSALLVFSALRLVIEVAKAARPLPAAAPPKAAAVAEDEDEEEDVFVTASRREWLAAIGWMTMFFGTLWLLGALIAIPLFALVYLLVASREKPVVAGAYAFACWLFVYGLFDRGLNIPLPAGALLKGLADGQ